MVASKAGAYQNNASFRCFTLLALPTNIRLGWKGLAGTNTLAYYEHLQITAVKSLITLTPGKGKHSLVLSLVLVLK